MSISCNMVRLQGQSSNYKLISVTRPLENRRCEFNVNRKWWLTSQNILGQIKIIIKRKNKFVSEEMWKKAMQEEMWKKQCKKYFYS